MLITTATTILITCTIRATHPAITVPKEPAILSRQKIVRIIAIESIVGVIMVVVVEWVMFKSLRVAGPEIEMPMSREKFMSRPQPVATVAMAKQIDAASPSPFPTA